MIRVVTSDGFFDICHPAAGKPVRSGRPVTTHWRSFVLRRHYSDEYPADDVNDLEALVSGVTQVRDAKGVRCGPSDGLRRRRSRRFF